MRQAVEHRERFDPLEEEGRLIDAEHRGRYRWAAQLAAGRDVLDAGCGSGYGMEILASAGARAVTGVDVDPDAVRQAEERFGDWAEAVVEGDLRELPFDEESFDLVVCFETIEHLEDGERALAEVRRVLRDDGLLVVSSPNPDVYPTGNEHHLREYRPAELTATVGELFANLGRYGQHAWLASAIEPATVDAPANGNGADPAPPRQSSWPLHRTAALEPGGETYGIVVASDGELPSLDGAVALGDAFEVRWWSEQVANAKAEAEKAEVVRAEAEQVAAEAAATRRDAEEAIAEAEAEAGKRIHLAEQSAQRAVAQSEAREAEALERLRKASTSLLDANQELAQIPLLKHRMAEVAEEYAQLGHRFNELTGSKSWRLTAPIRRLRRGLRPRR